MPHGNTLAAFRQAKLKEVERILERLLDVVIGYYIPGAEGARHVEEEFRKILEEELMSKHLTKAEIDERLKRRGPFSGDPDDPEGKKPENQKKREEAERQHGSC